MEKMVCHVEKYKKGNVVSRELHNERKNKNYSNEEIDLSRTHRNFALIQRDTRSYYRSVMDLVDKRNNPTGKAMRKDAVVLCETVISSSNDFFKGLSIEEQRRFFEDAAKYLQDFFGKENCIYATVHFDEHTPHMHFGFVPLTKDKRLCAKEVTARSELLRLQDELPRFLQDRGFQIERGESGSTAVHKSVRQYKADMEKEKATLEASIQKDKKELSRIASQKIEIKSVEQIPTGKTMFSGKVTVDSEDYRKVASLAKKQLAAENREKKLSRELSSVQKENAVLKTENEEMRAQLSKRQSVTKRLSAASMETELRELRAFRWLAEKFLSEHGLLDYFRKAFIHSKERGL